MLALDDSAAAVTRPSRGLEHFLLSIRDTPGLSILDLGGANQFNISFLTGMGHRLFSENVLRSLDECFGDGDFYANQEVPERAEAFFQQTLDYLPGQFDGILAWDCLQFLTPSLLAAVVERLGRITRPEAFLLATFDADERAEYIVSYCYRIMDAKTLQLSPMDRRRPAQVFNNRALEKVFHDFSSLKFFLARDHLREVIIRR